MTHNNNRDSTEFNAATRKDFWGDINTPQTNLLKGDLGLKELYEQFKLTANKIVRLRKEPNSQIMDSTSLPLAIVTTLPLLEADAYSSRLAFWIAVLIAPATFTAELFVTSAEIANACDVPAVSVMFKLKLYVSLPLNARLTSVVSDSTP